MREVVVDLPLHATHLLADGGGEIVLPRGARTFRLVCENGERRLQSVRQIPGLGDRTRHHLLAMLEERIQVRDERLDFCRIGSAHGAIAAVADGGQPRSQMLDRRQRVFHVRESRDHAEDRDSRPDPDVREETVKNARP